MDPAAPPAPQRLGDLTKAYHWVLADRDKSPDLPKRFDVSAYPTLLVLGTNDENVHRWEGYRNQWDLGGNLAEGLRRYALHRAGKPWDEPAPRPATICDGAKIETFRAPSEDVPTGLAFVGDDLWIAQGGKLRRLDARHAVAAEFELSPSVVDLTSDGKVLYALESGWTAGLPIRVIDPATGKETRTIVTEANKESRSYGAKGIVWRDGRLYVLEGMMGRVHVVDPATGVVERKLQIGPVDPHASTNANWLTGLDFDGTTLVVGSQTRVLFVDPADGKVVRALPVTHTLPVNYPLRTLASHGGRLYLMEQPIFGHDRDHKRVRVWPKETLVHVAGQ